MKLLQIMEGWRNHLVPPKELKDIIDVVQKERLDICKDCAFNSKRLHADSLSPEHCVACGCVLVAKTACLSCKCPKEKWNEIDVKEKQDE